MPAAMYDEDEREDSPTLGWRTSGELNRADSIEDRLMMDALAQRRAAPVPSSRKHSTSHPRSRAHSVSQPDVPVPHPTHLTPPPSRPHSQHRSNAQRSAPTPPTPAMPYPPSLTSTATSARSSAYTSPGTNGNGAHDYARVSPFDDQGEFAFYDKLQRSQQLSEFSFGADSENTRWSESYSTDTRSRANSWIAMGQNDDPNYDWNAGRGAADNDDTTDDEDEDAYDAAAVAMAEDGSGLIVQGQGVPVSVLQVNAGTTHLLLASSLTPNTLPSFLIQTLPNISSTLVALDISANFLAALPPPLAGCVSLEELNVSANPLRALPTFLGNLTSLRVLIADSITLTCAAFPATLAALTQLHTLSLRRNKLNALPAWMCLLPSLETLLVDQNPFLGEFVSLLAPLMAKADTPMTPSYPPNTPALGTYPSDNILTDSGPPSADPGVSSYFPATTPTPPEAANEAEDYTARYSDYAPSSRAPVAAAQSKSMYETTRPESPATSDRSMLTRRGTAPSRPSRAANVVNQLSALDPQGSGGRTKQYDDYNSEDEQTSSRGSLRRMRSAAELRFDGHPGGAEHGNERPLMARSGSSNALAKYGNIFPATMAADMDVADDGDAAAKYGSTASRRRTARANTTTSMYDRSRDRDQPLPPTPGVHTPGSSGASTPYYPSNGDRDSTIGKAGKPKWGFLKKMSMGKIKADVPPLPAPPATAPLSPPRMPTSPPKAARILGESIPTDLAAIAMGSVTSSPGGIDSPTLRHVPSVPSLAIPPPQPLQPSPTLTSPSPYLAPPGGTTRSARRRSFLPIDRPLVVSTADTLTPLSIPPSSARSSTVAGTDYTMSSADADSDVNTLSAFSDAAPQSAVAYDGQGHGLNGGGPISNANPQSRHLRSVMSYLRDMSDLGAASNKTGMTGHSSGSGSGHAAVTATTSVNLIAALAQDMSLNVNGLHGDVMGRPPMGDRVVSDSSYMSGGSDLKDGATEQQGEDRMYKNDKAKRAKIVREIVETERTYVKGLNELVDIYIRPASIPVTGINSNGKETIVPLSERKVVFNGLESLFSFHQQSFLPALEGGAAPLFTNANDEDGHISTMVAITIANVFLSHAAFMKMYSTYINNFDNSVHRLKDWTKSSRSQSQPATPAYGPPSPPTAMESPNQSALSAAQRKRIKGYLKRCRINPRHSQLNLEAYLLLPIQRIPRYKMLLEQLVRSTPPKPNSYDDPLDRALNEIAGLAMNMNEGKRDAEWRKKLVQWQSRIRGKFPSPLVQPHRRLIKDGHLMLKRVMRLRTVNEEIMLPGGEKATVPLEQLQREATPRFLVAILCNDLLVLCKDPSGGKDPNCLVDLWAVLRMQTLPQPASVTSHSKELRIVDNKAILYFECDSTHTALSWSRAINLHVPTLKS